MGKFLFIADNLALDLVNTEMVSDGQRIDALQTPDDLRAWLAQAPTRKEPHNHSSKLDAKEWASLFREALALRSAIRLIAAAIVEKRQIPRASLGVINRLLRSVPLHREIACVANRCEWSERFTDGSPNAMLYPVARAAGDLLVEGKFDRVKRCGNPECILFLYDTTRSHTRQWCSMSACGNRMKVAAFYERQRARKAIR